MDLLTTILSCSLYLADDDLVRAIAQSTSDANPNFVVDASVDWTEVDPPPIPRTSADALARTKTILAKGGRPLLGLMQVPPASLSAFGREVARAFDPCTNVAVGTAMLSQFDFECAAGTIPTTDLNQAPKTRGSPPTRASSAVAHPASAVHRLCVLRRYESAIGLRDFAAVTTLEIRHQRAVPPTVEEAPIFVPATREGAGADSLLVPTGTLAPWTLASTP
jgi:hypothetical protein